MLSATRYSEPQFASSIQWLGRRLLNEISAFHLVTVMIVVVEEEVELQEMIDYAQQRRWRFLR